MSKSQQKLRADVYTEITEKIVADLEKGVRTCSKSGFTGQRIGRGWPSCFRGVALTA